MPDKEPHVGYHFLLSICVKLLQKSVPRENPISFYRLNIQKKLAIETKGFNHASYQCGYPSVTVD